MKYDIFYNEQHIATQDLKPKEVSQYEKALKKGLPKAEMVKVEKPKRKVKIKEEVKTEIVQLQD